MIRSFLFLAIQAILTTGLAQPDYPKDPNEAALVYSDLEHFVSAYNLLNKDSDTLQVLNEFYLSRASAGLKEFINRHGLTAEMIREAIRKYPKDYSKIEHFLKRIGSFEQLYTQKLRDYKAFYQKASYPPTYLMVGANRGIAQGSKVGQLVTVTAMLHSDEHLLKFIIHELTHFQQAMAVGISKYGALFSQEKNMLGLCLREGAAEFVTFKITGTITQDEALDYLQNHEEALKLSFMEDLGSQNKSQWLWESLEQSAHPKLLGYAMGFKICEAYYEQSNDLDKALTEILSITDAETFLDQSKFFK